MLYRSNAQSRVVEHALFNAGMPYRVYGGLRFFERAEVKHALAYLRLVTAPEDDGAFLRVVNFPARGIGARSLETLQERARVTGTSLWQAACSAPQAGKAGGSIGGFVRLIESMRQATSQLTLSETVEHIVLASGLLDYYATEKGGQERIDNLRELVSAAESFTREAEQQIGDEALDPLTAFLAHAALEAGEMQAAEGTAALQLMTVHAAHRFRHRPRGRTLSAREQPLRIRRRGGREKARLRRGDTCEKASLSDACAKPHAARPAALQRCVALCQ